MRKTYIFAGVVLLFVGLGAASLAVGDPGGNPLAVVTHYPLGVLAEEGRTMVECAECHDTAAFHTCDTCHDDHGAVEFEEVPFYAVVTFTGDVPEPGYLLLDEVLPYRDLPYTHVPLLEFLAEQGVTDFESVTLASDDGGLVTIERSQLTGEALLMPYVDGVRFAAEDLHVSTWLKGITRIVVVGEERPLTADGEATSMGRLLLGPLRAVTVEATSVMLKSEEDGEVREAQTAKRVEGAPLEAVVVHPDFASLTVEDAQGQTHALTAAEAEGAVLALLRGQPTLVLPGRARANWIPGVVAITSEP